MIPTKKVRKLCGLPMEKQQTLEISELKLRNFRSITNSTISFEKESIIIGKNNIGKTSLIEAFSAFNRELKPSDININLLEHLMTNLKNPQEISDEDCVLLQVTFRWENLSPEYWGLLSEISDSGKTVVQVKYFIPEENRRQLTEIESVEELVNSFVRSVHIGSKDDLKKKSLIELPAKTSLKKLLPLPSNVEYANPGEILLFPIMAFRYVDSGKMGNDEATANQFSDRITSILNSDKGTQDLFSQMQGKIDNVTKEPMRSFQEDLKSFAYPRDPAHPLNAILTIDEWMKNPKVRIAQKFEKIKGFELPLKSQGLGYQNIYNILARITSLFSKMADLGLRNPVVLVIEEPEAFTHPQLQHIFIQQIRDFTKDHASKLGISYQLILISHSPEIAVSAFEMEFQIIIGRKSNDATLFLNWDSLSKDDTNSRESLKKLIMNYNAELLFADKLIAIEGDSERLIMTSLIRKVAPELLSEKIAYIPVGTRFHKLQSVLAELNFDKILLITDIDFKMNEEGPFVEVDGSIKTTNPNISYLFDDIFPGETRSINLKEKFDKQPKLLSREGKLNSNGVSNSENPNFKIVSQGYNSKFSFWPRTLESALVCESQSNVNLYKESGLLKPDVSEKLQNNVWELNDIENNLLKCKKADFALETLNQINIKGFIKPKYLESGLQWLIQ